jgi:hypothetical protein
MMRKTFWTAIAASSLAIALGFATPAAAVTTEYGLFGVVDTLINPAGLGDFVIGHTLLEGIVRVDPDLRFDVTATANAVYGTHYTRLEAAPVGASDFFGVNLVVLTTPPPIVVGFERSNFFTTPDALGIAGPYALFNNGRFFTVAFGGVSVGGVALFSAGAGPFPFDFVGGDVRVGSPSFGGHLLIPGDAPEPAAWALMIAGFGLAGAALRRRRSLSAG